MDLSGRRLASQPATELFKFHFPFCVPGTGTGYTQKAGSENKILFLNCNFICTKKIDTQFKNVQEGAYIYELCVTNADRFQIMLSIDKNIFATNLLLTQQYCEIQKTHTEKNNTSIFRSFNPQIKGDNIFKFKLSDYGLEETVKFCFLTDWSIDPTERENEYLINDLFEKQLTHKRAIVAKNFTDTMFSGDILIAQVDNTVIDGASAVVSGGLIDDFDCPPIDTWFYQTQSTEGRLLFAWIPHEFITFANDAVLANCVDCINWFKNWYPNEHRQVTEYLNQHTTT